MNQPRLTIGIPHLDRGPLLARAIVSCLEQKTPVRVIVADQGKTERTRDVIARYHDQPELRHIASPATCLWENWDFAARQCDTEFFAWLQDDDVVNPRFSERVIGAFERFPDACLWMACNRIGLSPQMAYWTSSNGPWVPMDFLAGTVDQWEGQILVPTSYFLAWGLSPAVAFRTGEKFTRALDLMPPKCDCFAERSIVAGMAYDGLFIADPMTAGIWIHHGEDKHGQLHSLNESDKQHEDQPRQATVMIQWLDELMPKVEGWQEILAQWALLMHPGWVMSWVGELDHVVKEAGIKGKYSDEVKKVLLDSLKGRIKVVRRMGWREQVWKWIRDKAAIAG
jgi:hypothetical protein